MQIYHPDYGCMEYRKLKPGEWIRSKAEARAAYRYLKYRRDRGLPHAPLLIVGDTVYHLPTLRTNGETQ